MEGAAAEGIEGMLHTVGGKQMDERAVKRRKERAIELTQAMKDLATAHGGPRRQMGEARAAACELGNLSRADGSARWSSGKTEVLVAVWGPMEATERDENFAEATVEVQYRPISGLAGDRERHYEETIQSVVKAAMVLSAHPRCAFSLTVQVVEDDGAVLSAAINAAFLALVDAGAPLRTSFCAASCACKGSEIMADPTREEEEEGAAVLTAVIDMGTKGIVATCATGTLPDNRFEECLQTCRKLCERVLSFGRSMVKRKLDAISVSKCVD
eukprot:TRINITY_DN2416_c0_g1_i2.p1 TRINITY_DN2416_c0_g1~~TRINITY_DN2416_c0_g1_i2.p1  ORF type:complete len:271 (-),score=65.37 TRINITY_DN2416_c0_g1_i2:82-894(-)